MKVGRGTLIQAARVRRRWAHKPPERHRPPLSGSRVVWLIDAEGGRYQLAVVFQGGWRVMDATPAERALIEAHGFASGRVQ